MKTSWLPVILIISLCLLTLLKLEEQKSLMPFFKAERAYKLANFERARKIVSPQELELLELWESMLTGRSAPVARWIKFQYQQLGLNHLFTPSGFHLSAVMLPFMKFIKSKNAQGFILFIIALVLFNLRGQGALKRMVLIKLNQHFLGQKTGFIIALLMDVLLGSFNNSPLSFCYSFLFLGIIYSRSAFMFLWFFFAQCLIAYFSGALISPLIIVLSPLLNLAFALAMPLLFLLAIPLCHWQLYLGLKILSILQQLVTWSAQASGWCPNWEVNFGVLICFFFIYLGRRRMLALTLLVLSFNLNLDTGNMPAFGKYEFVPRGEILKIIQDEKGETVYWSDGKCRRDLVRGIWWEKCSPRRRSTGKKA